MRKSVLSMTKVELGHLFSTTNLQIERWFIIFSQQTWFLPQIFILSIRFILSRLRKRRGFESQLVSRLIAYSQTAAETVKQNGRNNRKSARDEKHQHITVDGWPSLSTSYEYMCKKENVLCFVTPKTQGSFTSLMWDLAEWLACRGVAWASKCRDSRFARSALVMDVAPGCSCLNK